MAQMQVRVVRREAAGQATPTVLGVSTHEAARITNLGVEAIRQAIRDGELPAIRHGSGKALKYIVLVSSLEGWLKRLETKEQR